jgi:hypothetical protein
MGKPKRERRPATVFSAVFSAPVNSPCTQLAAILGSPLSFAAVSK